MMGILFNIILAHEGGHEEYLKETPTFTLHRYMGYAIIIGSAINVGTGLYLLNQYENGKVPPDYIRIPHRAMGYTVFTLSTIQTALGTYNNFKLWKEEGRLKRLIHGALAYAATGSYLYAGYKAYKGDFESHRNFMLLASGLSAITGIWIIF
ncbi:MAG: hypothetical protein ABIL16_07930 [candidate division WOR-3 bacterium]